MAGHVAGSVPAQRQDIAGLEQETASGGRFAVHDRPWMTAMDDRSGLRRNGGAREPEEQDPEAVMDAAALLDVAEFDLFRLAYRRRFGRQPGEDMLEKVFADYMLRGHVPAWVTALCREVIEREKRGVLDAEVMGAGRFRDRPARPPHGALYVGAAMAAWLVLMVCLLDLRPDPQIAAECRIGGTFFHDWAAMISGRPRDSCGPATGSR